MIIRTNFYAEILEREHQKRYSPARKATAAGLFVVTMVVAYWGMLQYEVKGLRAQAAVVHATEASVHKDLTAARERAIPLAARIHKREQILGLAKSRTNWGPVLEAVFSSVPLNVQLFELKLSALGNSGSVHLSGRVAGEQSRMEGEKFRILLLDTIKGVHRSAEAKFVNLEDSAEPVHRSGQSMPVSKFTIEVLWKGGADAK